MSSRLRALALSSLGLALACDRGPAVEALPLPDAEPPVVIIGPGRDSGVRATKGKGRDAAVRADAGKGARDAEPALIAEAPRATAPPDEEDEAPPPVRPRDDDGVPTYVLDERDEAAKERESPRASESPRVTPSPSASPTPSPSSSRTTAPAGHVTSGAKGPLVLTDAATGRLDVMSRDAALLGQIDLGGAIVRGVAHDRRDGDGVWILVAGSPPMIAKIGWDGRRIRGYEVRRPPLRRAQKFLGIDHVMGHSASSDILLVLYINKLGLPVVEGLLVRDGTSRFTVGFSREADVSGVRADGFRHDAVDGLLVMDWWTIRAGNHLERWRFFYGFVDRIDDRPLEARVDAFDIPPWREVWGADRAGRRVVRMSGDGDVVQSYPAPEIEPAFLAISP